MDWDDLIGRPSQLSKDYYSRSIGLCSSRTLYRDVRDDLSMLQRMMKMKSLPVHRGCVNTICWNETGDLILSGSDDHSLVVTHGHRYKVLDVVKTNLRSNIFCARFLPKTSDTKLIACAGDGTVLHVDLQKPEETADCHFSCHVNTAYEVVTVPNDPNSFLTCGEDGTVRWFDLRTKTRCSAPDCREDVLIDCRRPASAMAIDPQNTHYLAVGTSDSCVRIYDRRCLSTKLQGGALTICPEAVCRFTIGGKRRHRLTSVCYSDDGSELLASFWSDQIYLMSTRDLEVKILEPVPRAVPVPVVQEEQQQQQEEEGVSGLRTGDLPIKRLRLRGDWSDTGPNARPEGEPGADGSPTTPAAHSAMMRNMTTVLGRMLRDSFGNRSRRLREAHLNASSSSSAGAGSSASEESGAPSDNAGATSSEEEALRLQLGKLRRAAKDLRAAGRVPTMRLLKSYSGHRNARTMIKEACFWGSKYVMSGSDCGHVFVWDKETCEQVMMVEADRHVVNCIQPHPTLPMFATSGIDYDVKIWAPMGDAPYFDEARAEKLRDRNKIMLQETKDTVTIPVSFMIRLLTSIHGTNEGAEAPQLGLEGDRRTRQSRNGSSSSDGPN